MSMDLVDAVAFVIILLVLTFFTLLITGGL